ncbi:MAG TPA: efflux transporter outer membrane subunit [Sphingobium sp.]|uniref:efflux transporter outer membrane subunit n=1 Tax=Sphingobium sp. TaxID=1912891 RepID=UPI002ED0AE70
MTLRRAAPFLALTALAGCTVGPNFERPQASVSGGYADPGRAPRKAPVVTPGEGPQFGWWTAFGSPELDRLVNQAMANNQSLAASNATLAKARARIDAVAGKRLPQVDGNARIEHEQVNLQAFGFDPAAFGQPGAGNPVFNLYTVGGGVSYDLDVFGANRRAVEQSVAQAEAQQHQTEAAHLTIAGRVVSQVLTIAAIRERIATSQQIIAEGQRNVRLTDARCKAGAGTLVEVLSAQGQLANDQADLPQLDQQLVEARAMLATLIGLSPAELGATDFDFTSFTLPSDIPVTMPSLLVRKRPDILQAEADLHAATAAIGIATARLYPDITLGATLSGAASTPGDIFGSNFRGFDIFAGLSAPIFHGGTLKANKRGAEADAQARVATYKETVLEAFAQVSNLLAALNNDTRSVATQQQAADIASRSLRLSRRSFQVGNSGILTVLDSSRIYQRSRLSLVEARARQFLNVSRLYVATAGGWTGQEMQAAATDPATGTQQP